MSVTPRNRTTYELYPEKRPRSADNHRQDYVVIVSGDYFTGPNLITNDLLNINIYHADYFEFLLEEVSLCNIAPLVGRSFLSRI